MTRHPSFEEHRLWTALLRAAVDFGKRLVEWHVTPSAHGVFPSDKALARARKHCRHKVLPENQQTSDAPLMRLIREIDVMTPATASDYRWAADFLDLARLAEDQVNPAPHIRPRADIDE